MRRRSFCRYCGALTRNLDSCCNAHRELLAKELPPNQWRVPRDPLERLPMQSADTFGEDAPPTRERSS